MSECNISFQFPMNNFAFQLHSHTRPCLTNGKIARFAVLWGRGSDTIAVEDSLNMEDAATEKVATARGMHIHECE